MIQRGSLEVICGCMYSGKTEELIRRVKREEIAKRHVQVFKSHLDTRYSLESIITHDGKEIHAQQVSFSSSKRLESMLNPGVRVVAIDEIQFFDAGIVNVCDRLVSEGKRVIIAGLDLDFRGEPFSPAMMALLAKADKIDKLTAVCVECGEPAVRSQRLVDGKPAKWDEAVLVVGAYDQYRAVCRIHHRIEKPLSDAMGSYSLAITLPRGRFLEVEQKAHNCGVQPEELVQASIEELLKQPVELVQDAVDRLLAESE